MFPELAVPTWTSSVGMRRGHPGLFIFFRGHSPFARILSAQLLVFRRRAANALFEDGRKSNLLFNRVTSLKTAIITLQFIGKGDVR